jgi:hypothetical protein
LKPIVSEVCSQGYPESAICVQRFDDSLNSAIRITYRISLRSSSLREPRYPLLTVVQGFRLQLLAEARLVKVVKFCRGKYKPRGDAPRPRGNLIRLNLKPAKSATSRRHNDHPTKAKEAELPAPRVWVIVLPRSTAFSETSGKESRERAKGCSRHPAEPAPHNSPSHSQLASLIHLVSQDCFNSLSPAPRPKAISARNRVATGIR